MFQEVPSHGHTPSKALRFTSSERVHLLQSHRLIQEEIKVTNHRKLRLIMICPSSSHLKTPEGPYTRTPLPQPYTLHPPGACTSCSAAAAKCAAAWGAPSCAKCVISIS